MPLPLWGIVCSVPYNVICIWAILCMVPIRRPWLFALLWQIVCLPIFFIPAESAYGWLRTVLSSVLWLSLVLCKKAQPAGGLCRSSDLPAFRGDRGVGHHADHTASRKICGYRPGGQ